VIPAIHAAAHFQTSKLPSAAPVATASPTFLSFAGFVPAKMSGQTPNLAHYQ